MILYYRRSLENKYALYSNIICSSSLPHRSHSSGFDTAVIDRGNAMANYSQALIKASSN